VGGARGATLPVGVSMTALFYANLGRLTNLFGTDEAITAQVGGYAEQSTALQLTALTALTALPGLIGIVGTNRW